MHTGSVITDLFRIGEEAASLCLLNTLLIPARVAGEEAVNMRGHTKHNQKPVLTLPLPGWSDLAGTRITGVTMIQPRDGYIYRIGFTDGEYGRYGVVEVYFYAVQSGSNPSDTPPPPRQAG